MVALSENPLPTRAAVNFDTPSALLEVGTDVRGWLQKQGAKTGINATDLATVRRVSHPDVDSRADRKERSRDLSVASHSDLLEGTGSFVALDCACRKERVPAHVLRHVPESDRAGRVPKACRERIAVARRASRASVAAPAAPQPAPEALLWSFVRAQLRCRKQGCEANGGTVASTHCERRFVLSDGFDCDAYSSAFRPTGPQARMRKNQTSRISVHLPRRAATRLQVAVSAGL